MGIETIAIIGLSALSAASSVGQSQKEAESVARQGEIQAEEKGKEVRLKAARQQSSFLNSGLTLEGTPLSAIQSTFATGLEDIDLIRENANTRSKNIITSGRTAALGQLAGGAAGAFGGGGSSPFGGGQLDLSGSAKGITVPFTGSAPTFSSGGIPIPGTKPTRINF